MIDLVTSGDRRSFARLLDSMHADRKKVFIDMFGWSLSHQDGREVDSFDNAVAEYLVLADATGCGHRASIRLLRTDRPHLMSELFSDLCEVELPCGPNIREITRFCVAPGGRAAARLEARNMLARALIEYALLFGVTGYTAVCHLGLLQQVLAAGWTCRPLGMPRPYAGQIVGAFMIEMGPRTLDQMHASWRWPAPVLRLAGPANALAA